MELDGQPTLPSLDAASPNADAPNDTNQTGAGALERPSGPRRSTYPTPSQALDEVSPQSPAAGRRSPYARSPLRSTTLAPSNVAPPMTRTRSLPCVSLATSLGSSPSHSPVRGSSPVRSPAPKRINAHTTIDGNHSYSVPPFMDIESIAEDSELEIPPRPSPAPDFNGPLPSLIGSEYHSQTFPRSSSGRRRPVSPLYSAFANSPSQAHPSSFAMSGSASGASPSSTPPPTGQSKFNEPHPSYSLTLSMGSSVSSTPSSFRSRSPSISSLETIPDSPDAEEAASEAFNMAKLKAIAEAEEAIESDGERKEKTFDSGLGSGYRALASPAFGSTKDKRKRWSVCGAERRGDFEMETIWEDR